MPQTYLSLKEKMTVLDMSKSGKSARKIDEIMKVGKTQIQKIIKERDEIIKSFENNVPDERKKHHYGVKMMLLMNFLINSFVICLLDE